jgi:hypothetical protein
VKKNLYKYKDDEHEKISKYVEGSSNSSVSYSCPVGGRTLLYDEEEEEE